MKILLVHWYYPPQVGGVETLLQLWGEQLARRGHEVTVLAASLSEKDEIQQERDLRVVRLASFDPAKKRGILFPSLGNLSIIFLRKTSSISSISTICLPPLHLCGQRFSLKKGPDTKFRCSCIPTA
jgi:glycosyltransferase involved in cell wall biosynthesis